MEAPVSSLSVVICVIILVLNFLHTIWGLGGGLRGPGVHINIKNEVPEPGFIALYTLISDLYGFPHVIAYGWV